MHLAARLMIGALVGKILGFAREIEMARLLGASYVADSFRAGITATLLPIATMQGDIVPSVLIPLHRRWSEDGSAPMRFTLLTVMFGAMSLPVMFATWLLADQWVGILVAGFEPQAHALTVRFVRVMALSMPSSVIANCFSCVEISVGRSRIATIRASVQNLAVMGGIGLMVLSGNVMIIGWAFSASMAATALYGGIMLVLERELTFRGASIREAAYVSLDFIRRVRVLLVQPLADQGNILLERFLVSGVGVGALASIDYARTLSETAIYLISQPIGSVMLARTLGDRESTRTKVEEMLRPLLALALPASVFTVIFAPDIVTVVLRRGAFQDHAVALTSAALRGIAFGLWATTVGWVLIRMLNAAGRNRVAAFVLLCAAIGQAVVNLACVPLLGVMGVGLGESTRGVFMLIGAAFALYSGRFLLRLLLLMFVPLLGFTALALGICQIVSTPVFRLMLAGAGFAVGAGICLFALAPAFGKLVVGRLRLRRARVEL
jgi:putative peptidoglycan lipid II flippase